MKNILLLAPFVKAIAKRQRGKEVNLLAFSPFSLFTFSPIPYWLLALVWSAFKLLTGLVGIVLLHTFPFPAYADDVLEKLNLIEITISNLTIRIDALEKRLAAIEKTLIKAPKTEAKEPAKEVKPEPKPEEVVSPAGSEDFVSIGGGFLLGNVNYKASLGDTIFSGEIENQSAKGYKTVIFNIKVFDEKGTVLGGSDFYVQELDKGAKVPFAVTTFGINTKSIARYEIKFDRGF